MNKKFFLTFVSLSFLSILFYTKVTAQTATDASIPSQITEIQEQVDVNVEPGMPNPNETVKVSIEAYGTDLTKADITWKINGITAQKGRGLIELKTTAGDAGSVKKIDIAINPENGPEIDKSVTIAPEEVDLVWEAKTYTPPFYKGKALYTPQETVTVAAFPNFKADGSVGVDPSHLTYNWLNDNDTAQDYSGYGKNFMIFQGPIVLNSHTVTLNATSDSSAKSESFVNLNPIQPNVLVYEDSPLYGVQFNKALPVSFYLTNSEETLVAYPYYFGFKWRSDPDAQYVWNMNGQDISGTNQPSMVFKNTATSAGQTSVGIDVTSVSNFLVEASQALNISFGSNSNNSTNSVLF
ncbi:MAG: hypothetical protein WCK29_04455 [archaeon]